jgi:hypothetical protein
MHCGCHATHDAGTNHQGKTATLALPDRGVTDGPRVGQARLTKTAMIECKILASWQFAQQVVQGFNAIEGAGPDSLERQEFGLPPSLFVAY